MSEVAERYRAVAAGFTRRLERVPPAGWAAPSPCPDWTARDVAVHVVMTHLRVLARMEGTEAVDVQPDADLLGAWRAATGAVQEALDDPARVSTVMGGMFGDQPFEQLVGGVLCTDTLVHTWDLARATGQDETLDAGAVANASAFLDPLGEAIRRPGGFGAKLDPTPGADDQTRFLNFCGRAV